MSGATADRDQAELAATAGLPLVVGLAALVQGYPVPLDLGTAGGVLAGGLLLAGLGRAAWAGARRGLRVAPATVPLAVAGVLGWQVLAPGVDATDVGPAVVLAGDPVLARAVGTAPLFGLAVGCLALLEVAASGDEDVRLPAWLSPGLARTTALGRAAVTGLAVAAAGLAPGALLGDAVAAPPLLGFAAVGGVLGGTLVGYLWLRHRLLAPVVVLAVTAAAASVAVTAGGSPRGFPLAWAAWLLPGLLLGGVEAAVRGLRGRLLAD